MRSLAGTAAQLASPLLVAGLVLWVYGLLHSYDWGHPLVKTTAFATLLGLVAWLRRAPARVLPARRDTALAMEALLLAALLAATLRPLLAAYAEHAFHGPWVDVGYTTQNAARLFFLDGGNPYQSTQINPRAELPPEHRGFHYGPLMFLAYAASAWLPALGFKLTSLAALGVALWALAALLRPAAGPLGPLGPRAPLGPVGPLGPQGRLEWGVACAFAALIALGAERFWFELLHQGASDILPVALLLAGLVAHQRQHWLACGLLLGASFAAKFAPAFVFIALLLRLRCPPRLLVGLALGASPYLGFALWDARALVENVFLLRAGIGPDSTSLYPLLPEALHAPLRVLPLLLLAVLWLRAPATLPTPGALLWQGLLVLTAFAALFTEVHANHLLWFYPLWALALARGRHRLLGDPRPEPPATDAPPPKRVASWIRAWADTTTTPKTAAGTAPGSTAGSTAGPTRANATAPATTPPLAAPPADAALRRLWLIGLWLAAVIGLSWGLGPEPGWFADWDRWDGLWYRSIWEAGYAAQPHTIAFPPLYSLLVGTLSSVSGLDFARVAMLLNLLALLGAMRAMEGIYRDRFGLDPAPARPFLLCFPALYFVLAPYSDTLFLWLTLQVIALLSRPAPLGRGEQLLLIGLLFAAPLLRISGVIFLLLLLAGRWQALATGAGIALWLQINYAVAGTPLAFLAVQSEFLMAEGHLLDGLRGAWGGLAHLPPPADWVDWSQRHLAPIALLALALPLLAWLAWRRDWLLLSLLFALLALSHNQSFWRSTVRYDFPIWPLLPAPLLALRAWAQARGRPRLAGLALGAVLLLALGGAVLQWAYTQIFVRGGWAF